MTDSYDGLRQQVIDGHASREDAARFIAQLENDRDVALAGVDRFSREAVDANNRLTQCLRAGAELIRMLPKIAGESDRVVRIDLAEQATERFDKATPK